MGWFRDCTSGIAKYILFFFNLLILICAVTLIVLSVMYKQDNAGIDVKSVSTLAIALGVLIALIAFFGCCGAIKESSCLLTTYAAILLTIFIIQVVLAILAFVAIRNNGSDIEPLVREHLTNLYNNRLQSKSDTAALDAIHRSNKCCGLNGPTGPEVLNGTQLMTSCCSENVAVCTADNDQYVFHRGCVEALTEFLRNNVKTLGIIAITFAVVELLCVIFAFYVRNTISRQGKYV